jgi:hypothetical protein
MLSTITNLLPILLIPILLWFDSNHIRCASPSALSTLDKELNLLNKIPTWPCQHETVCWLVPALVLPLGLWIIQFVLQRVFGN